MAVGRSRTQDLRWPATGSYYYKYGSPPETQRSPLYGEKTVTDDVVGNYWYANAFSTVKTYRKFFSLSGTLYHTLPPYDKLRAYSACPDALVVEPPAHDPSLATLSLLDRSNKAWTILANTNPSVAHVSVPTFIGELKDLPSLVFKVRKAGIALIERGSRMSRIARSHLVYRWALMPALRDLKTLFNFQAEVDNRVRMLINLRDRKWLSKRTGLGEQKIIKPPVGIYVDSFPGYVHATKHETHTLKEWGTVRWKILAGTKFPPTADGLREYATRISLGLTGYEAFSTLWELTPWSWLADWFLNIGTMVSALNNTIPCTWSEMCLMRTLETRVAYVGTSGPPTDAWVTISGNKVESRISKLRLVVSPSVPFVTVTVPLVSARTWLVLGSLAILKTS